MTAVRITRGIAEAWARAFLVKQTAIEDIDVDEGAFDHTITDPPYAPRTQDHTRRGHQGRTGISEVMPLGFEPMSLAKRRRWAQWIATATRRWAAVFSDHESSVGWAEDLERAGMVYMRTAIWLREGGAPQFTGDRPAPAHECIVLAYKTKAPRWNGGGKVGRYDARVVTGEIRAHPAQKPLSVMLDLVRDLTDPGEICVDPFCGAGTTLVAAKNTGTFCVGLDLSAKHASYAARRVEAAAWGER